MENIGIKNVDTDIRSAHERDLTMEEEGRSILLREERAKMRDMEYLLLELKHSFKGDEFKVFYDYVYTPQKLSTEKIAGFGIRVEEIEEHRKTVDDPLYILAEKVAKNLNSTLAVPLKITEMNKFITDKQDDF